MDLRRGAPLVTAIFLAATVLASAFGSSQAQNSVTNQDILNMVKGGLSAQVIVTSIERAPATHFDVQPSALVSLKAAGVPDAVLDAMVKATNPAPASGAPRAEVAPVPSSTAPSEAEVRTCVATADGLGRIYGSLIRIEYGTPMVSQGGIAEMQLGAPSGTKIYPVMVHFHDFRTGEVWVYRDPFGSLKCSKHGEIVNHPPTTPEEMAAAIKDGETVRLPVKVINGYGPAAGFIGGTISVSKQSLQFIDQTNKGITATMDHVHPGGLQNWQLQVNLEVKDPYRGNFVTQTVIFWDPGVQPGRGSSVDCSRCGNAMDLLSSLIKIAKGEGAPAPANPERDRIYGDAAARTSGSGSDLMAMMTSGQDVSVPIRLNSGVGGVNMVNGKVTINSKTLSFTASCCWSDFSIEPSKILELVKQQETRQSSTAWRIHLKVAIKNRKGDGEDKKDFYLYNAHATGEGIGPNGLSGYITCASCDDSLDILYALLERFRAGG